jgi:hypothetical protein
MGRHKLQTTNTIQFYQWQFECTEKPWWDPEGHFRCHSFAAITSCFSMIMHIPMSQGSVHNSWKLKMSQFFHGQHTHQICNPLNMFGMLWIDTYNSMFQFPATSYSHWRGVGQHSTVHNQQPDQLYALSKWWSHKILTDFLIHTPIYLF